jgi:hypothetical protein
MGPPEEVLVVDRGPEEKGLLMNGDVGDVCEGVELEGGRVSQESVRRQDCRTTEKDVGARGS